MNTLRNLVLRRPSKSALLRAQRLELTLLWSAYSRNAAELDQIRQILRDLPAQPCEVEDEVVTCGWKRAVGSIRWVLEQPRPTLAHDG